MVAEPTEVLFSRYGPGQTLQQTVHLRGVSGNHPLLRREIACSRFRSLCPQCQNKPENGCREANFRLQTPVYHKAQQCALQGAKSAFGLALSGTTVLLRLI